MNKMNDAQLMRYSRQIMLPQFDVAGQLSLLNARVLIIGIGGLGSPVASYLAAAGVGHLVLADHDTVDLSNLQRQTLHDQSTVGLPKVDSAAQRLAQLNDGVRIERIAERLEGDRLSEQVARADVVVDCTDNFEIRFAINRACVAHRTPLVSAAAIRFEGQLSVFDLSDDQSPCYQCLYAPGAEASLSCSESGVMAPLVGVMGSMQAMEVIKLISGVGQPAKGMLWLYDALHADWRKLKLKKDPACACCAG